MVKGAVLGRCGGGVTIVGYSAGITVSGPSKMVRLMTSVRAICGPWASPCGA